PSTTWPIHSRTSHLSPLRRLRELRQLSSRQGQHRDTLIRRPQALRCSPIHSLPDDLAACIASIEVVKRNFTSGDGKTELVWKIKLRNKPQVLELLGRHQGLFREDPPSDAPEVPAFALPPETPGARCH